MNYFWLCWVFIAARGLSLAGASRGFSAVAVLLVAVASHCGAWALECLGSVLMAHGLSLTAMWNLPRPGTKPCSLHWQANA